ncbi:ABC transporter ATP-binding protein [Clostridium estertheticum]|uniref:Quaternary amine transport ATP-binding protein n=1 Tax=Clostridium estertheticum TaxID=238834 RepID=A0A7Y3WQT6_9CLOT|nr:ABC transporter ATP-binding protein [Clostridium estertheticum]MBW9173151.1 ABC transporter ATP-binding protein [Clostridium estertheticum]NNU74386.1 ABC transporter ATP-binding protein [Clostridium estertheticum]WBL49110.1 ABC transporter ATP-binding protein [Clostridium estertheticum]WLC77204.1 ABC transporter ATP-binding protein [Clostridium estertheticum]
MIKFENVSKIYPSGNIAVNSLNLEIKKGEFFVIIGPSGCGKTTTLKMINRLINLSDGTIYIDEKKISEYNIHELRWGIGYVLQQIGLFPHMTIEENIAIVPELKKWDKRKIKDRITTLLESVGLKPDKYRHRKPSELSGGEQQRIGVIRALAADPAILLMDEPFSALDPISRKKLQQDIVNLQKKIKKTIVFVTHDMQEALALGDRICVMRDGEIVQCDTPTNILKNPKNDFVKNFFKSGNVYNTSIFSKPYQVKDMLDAGFCDSYKSGDVNLSIIDTESIENLLKRLENEKDVPVNHLGEIIGTINHEHLIKFISQKLEKGGEIS